MPYREVLRWSVGYQMRPGSVQSVLHPCGACMVPAGLREADPVHENGSVRERSLCPVHRVQACSSGLQKGRDLQRDPLGS